MAGWSLDGDAGVFMLDYDVGGEDVFTGIYEDCVAKFEIVLVDDCEDGSFWCVRR